MYYYRNSKHGYFDRKLFTKFFLFITFLLFSLFESPAYADKADDVNWTPIKYEEGKIKFTAKLPGESLETIHNSIFRHLHNHMLYGFSVTANDSSSLKTAEDYLNLLKEICVKEKDKSHCTDHIYKEIETNNPNVIFTIEIQSKSKINPEIHHINRIYKTANACYYFTMHYRGRLTKEIIQIIKEITDSLHIEE